MIRKEFGNELSDRLPLGSFREEGSFRPFWSRRRMYLKKLPVTKNDRFAPLDHAPKILCPGLQQTTSKEDDVRSPKGTGSNTGSSTIIF